MAAVPELDVVRISRYCEQRVPAEHRDDVRVEMGVRGRSITIFELHPPFHPGLRDWTRTKVAQFRYDPDAHLWTLYWSDRNGRWHPYPDTEPAPVETLLAEVTKDPTGIFWG